jgi:hypothetical protein
MKGIHTMIKMIQKLKNQNRSKRFNDAQIHPHPHPRKIEKLVSDWLGQTDRQTDRQTDKL